MFHGRLTTEEKDVVYAQIMEDSCRIILGTRALGQGLNLGDIVFIVLVGPDSCLETYIQKAGRGGRTGLGCEILSVFEDNNTQNFIGHFEKNLQKITSERVKQRVKRRFNQFRLLMNPV
jgi:ATP-dependent DNA helicase RecQ